MLFSIPIFYIKSSVIAINSNNSKSGNLQNQIIHIKSRNDLPGLQTIHPYISDFFQNPGIFELIGLFLRYGGWVLLVNFILFTYMFFNVGSLAIVFDSVLKGDDKKYSSKYANITYKDLDMLSNIIFCLKKMIIPAKKESIINELKNVTAPNVVARTVIGAFLFVIIMMTNLLANKFLLSLVTKNFRETFFTEFLNKVKFSSFSNPQRCIKYLNTVFGNAALMVDNLLSLAHYVCLFIATFIVCFKSGYSHWNMALILWLLSQLICSFLLFMVNKPTPLALELAIMENGFVLNIEMQRYFGIFENTKERYLDLLNKIHTEKMKKELLNYGITIFGGVCTLCTLGYGLIFGVLKIGGLTTMILNFVPMLNNFYRIPKETANMLTIANQLKDSLYPFECKEDSDDYKIIRKEKMIKQIMQRFPNFPIGQGENINLNLERYLVMMYPNVPIFENQGMYFMAKHNIKKIKKIEFVNVTFRYPNSQEPRSMTNVSFKIDIDENKGGIVWVCGKSGTGKSTIYSLLLQGDSELENGFILINGFLRELIKEDFLRLMIISTQFTPFVRCLIRESIGSVIIKSDKKKVEMYNQKEQIVDGSYFNFLIEKAFVQSGLNKMIGSLDYDVYDGGSNLSGGMRALMSLARLILQILIEEELMKYENRGFQKSIAIIDEILASLDSKTANIVIKYIMDLLIKYKMTGFFIDHSGWVLRFIQDPKYNKNLNIFIIFVTQNGVISGKVQDLLKNPEFRAYWQEQIDKINKG